MLIQSTCSACGAVFSRFPSQAGPYCSRLCACRTNNRKRVVPLVDRFWANVVKSDDPDVCWQWTAACHDFGYGVIGANNRRLYAHHISWELHFGPIPRGLQVLHTCDNPPCSNPRHLFLGTQGDNNRDMFAKGRNWAVARPEVAARGEQNAAHKLTERQVLSIKARLGSTTKAALARECGVTLRVITLIERGETWKHVVSPASQGARG